jgi:hypothetical protein
LRATLDDHDQRRGTHIRLTEVEREEQRQHDEQDRRVDEPQMTA